ncbi:MAG: hypothetical protein ACI9XU_000136 [Arenicella sp.]|jgi:hypothetical protein
MDTKRITILVFATALLAAALSAFISSMVHRDVNNKSLSQAQILDRFERLENNLTKEREARLALQNLLKPIDSMAEPNNRLENAAFIDISGKDLDSDSLALDSFQDPDAQKTAIIEASQSLAELKRLALINTGLSEDEAAYILRTESDATLAQLNSRYQSQREAFERSEPQDRPSLAKTNPLRAKLGDDYYENYLKANGFPTTARISSVIESSPGYNAGLKAGDRITSYAGKRVFNLNDVANLTFQGNPGESVLLEIVRNGEALQLTIPRGPIGVSSGRNVVEH